MAQSNGFVSQTRRLAGLAAAALLAVSAGAPPLWAQGSGGLSVSKLSIKLNFAKPDSDKIGAKALLDVPAGVAVEGLRLVVDVGGVVRTFTLDAKGKATSGTDKIAIKPAKDGAPATMAVKFAKGNFAASLADEGLTNVTVADLPASVMVAVTVNDDPQPQATAVTVMYKAKAGKTGKAK